MQISQRIITSNSILPNPNNSQTYISIKSLEIALKELMERRGVKSWIQTAFDASDIDELIHAPYETVTLPDHCERCDLRQEA